MDLDRRALLASASLVGSFSIGGCARADAGRFHDWSAFRQRFLMSDGRIVDNGNGSVSHSEGQGYGLLLAAAANDKEAFDRIWSWTRTTLGVRGDGLFAWRFDPNGTPTVADLNNASDGDILIAWALYRAAKRWNESAYADASQNIRAALLRLMIRPIGKLNVLLPGEHGFDTADGVVYNPSYYIWPALDAFRREDGHELWDALIEDGQRLQQTCRFGAHALTPDWAALDAHGGLKLAVGREPRFGYDALRVPLYLIWSGRSELAQPFAIYWREMERTGKPAAAWTDLNTGVAADYPLSLGGVCVERLTTGQALPAAALADTDYFSCVLAHLTFLAHAETNPFPWG